MTCESFRYALIMLAAGIGIPIAALNAQLGNRIGSSATVLFLVALCVTSLALLLTPR